MTETRWSPLADGSSRTKKTDIPPPRWPRLQLGIKKVDGRIWLASFMHYDLGYIDLEQKTLQPIDNPFGTRLLPMS